MPSTLKSSTPEASIIAGARWVTNIMLVFFCARAANNIPAIILAPAPGSVIASSSSAKISFGVGSLTTVANSTSVCSSAPALCVPPALARI